MAVGLKIRMSVNKLWRFEMEITAGFVMLIVGVAGAVICLLFLLATNVIFPRQRKRLLEKLQNEDFI